MGERTDESKDGVVAKELMRLRLLVQRGSRLDLQGELLEAVDKGRLEVVRFLVKECGADVSIQDRSGWTALMLAACNGHKEVVRFLVNECGADVNIQDNNGETALMMAASRGHKEVMRFLVKECDADVNIQDRDGRTALMMATRGDHMEVVRFLVKGFGADVNIQDKHGRTAFMMATEGGHVEVVWFLVKECGADVNIQSKDGTTALIQAARDGHKEVVQFLVKECGADVNIQDKEGSTALIEAARGGHMDVVRFLVNECGADVNIQSKFGWTALIEAARGGHMEVVRFLVNECGADVNIQSKDGTTALIQAARDGHKEVVQFLVKECGADVNIQGEYGSTTLMKAAEGGHKEVVRFLVNECGADVNIQDKGGETALMMAASRGHKEVMRFLVKECDADVNIQDKHGRTAFMMAAKGGHVEVVRFLVKECGADVNIQYKDGRTALMRAAGGGHMEVVRFLVNEAGADVNIQNKEGSTALINAARGGHMDVVRFLVKEGGADVNIQSKYGWTALMKAASRGHMEVVRFLVKEGGADVNLRNKEAQTAIRIASDRGHNDMVRLLTPFAQPDHRSSTHTSHKLLASYTSRSLEISPSEVELGEFYEQRNIGGDFRVKWLDADAVAKLLIADLSVSTFEQEVRAWQELRHPNVLKLYGVCQAAPSVNFFVCEYASQGSLAEYTMSSSSSPISSLKPLTWKFLYETALGLEYLHERGIIHGDLRCSNILIGNDKMAKLSNFRSTGAASSVIRSMRWQAPEVLKGEPPSRESDVYSLGMCVLEAASGKRPWPHLDERSVKFYKEYWNNHACANVPYNQHDHCSPIKGDILVRKDDPYFVRRSRELAWRMCCKNSHGRSSLTSIVSELEQLSIEESPNVHQSEPEFSSCFEVYKEGAIEERWDKLLDCMNGSGNTQHRELFDKLKHICDRLRESEHSERLLDGFYSLVIDFFQTVKMTPEESWAMQLSSTRATTTSMISLSRRVNALLKALGESVPDETEISWQQQRHEQGADFVSGIADTVLLLQSLKSVEEQAAFLTSLRSEMENLLAKYTEEQLRTMKKTYEAIMSKLTAEVVENASTLTPKWFIPWYELILGEDLGAGSFGSVRRAKWLDSDVVVKEVLLTDSDGTASSDSDYDSYAPRTERPTDPQSVAKRAKAQVMFRREADIWFGFSHPHVVRLFGACHIGRPFFVCEYATHSTLNKYLQKHPDDLWAKLHEAALGIQYLHAREVVHGDLKGNNVVLGSDLKAKVTDFGLSMAVGSEGSAPISGAWHWVAPECLVDKKAGVKPTFESDVYSLGMCIVEALRVVEAVQKGKSSYGCLPWGILDNPEVKYHVTQGKIPPRPSICTDDQWNLVTQMCVSDPKKRIKISTVVDELERFVAMTTGTNMNNQVDHVIDDMTALTHPMNQESVVSMTATARKLLSERRSRTNQEYNSPVVLYASLWDRIEHVRDQIDEGGHDEACKSAFHSLVVEAGTSTTASLEATTEDLISLARVVMKCYALSRRLDKLCDAYFLKSPRELAFPKYSGQQQVRLD